MAMITQNTSEKQDVMENIFRDIPIVLAADDLHLYFLIKDINKDLETFIFTGKKNATEFQVFSKKDMQKMSDYWKGLGLKVTYHSQNMNYLYTDITIIYPQISDPKTNMNISLIPWFMLPDRPYPIFIYIYSIWHYLNSERKSQRLSAEVTRELFGLNSFNKSTICRNLKVMEHLFAIFQINRPLSTDTQEAPSIKDIISDIPKVLKECPSIETLRGIYGDRAAQLPERINNKENISCSLSGIPNEYSKVIKESEPIRGNSQDSRKRTSRPRKKRERPVKLRLSFVESQEIKQKREAFIAYCRNMIMDAATTYHQLLL